MPVLGRTQAGGGGACFRSNTGWRGGVCFRSNIGWRGDAVWGLSWSMMYIVQNVLEIGPGA